MSRPSRRQGREAALQLLYQVDLTGDSGDKAFEAYWASWPDEDREGDIREFAEHLVRFVLTSGKRIDEAIDAAAKNWDLERFSRVDLNLLRLGVAELFASPEVPPPVVINEAVEIAHRFSDEKAAAFINGVLDRVARDSGLIAGAARPAQRPKAPTVAVSKGTARTPRTSKTSSRGPGAGRPANGEGSKG